MSLDFSGTSIFTFVVVSTLFTVAYFFFILCSETLSPPYISSPSLIYRGHLKVCFNMRLVIIVNTILYLNSLNITGSVCCVCKSKVNRKERSRPFLFVCLFCFTFGK